MVECQTGVTLPNADAILSAGREEGKEHSVQGRTHVDDYVIVLLVHRLPHLIYICEGVVALLVSKCYYAVDGGMSLEKGRNLLVQHEVYLCLRKTPTQSVEQRGAEDGITHLAETYYEYLVQFTVHNSQFTVQWFKWFNGSLVPKERKKTLATCPVFVMLAFHHQGLVLEYLDIQLALFSILLHYEGEELHIVSPAYEVILAVIDSEVFVGG